jgi:hypothetical protein
MPQWRASWSSGGVAQLKATGVQARALLLLLASLIAGGALLWVAIDLIDVYAFD